MLLLCTSLQAAPAAAKPERVFDFGDYTSAALIDKAWKALESADTEAVLAYVGKCRELHEGEALRQQAALKVPVPSDNREQVFAQWALNDVGVGLFILGQLHERQKRPAEALAAYKTLVEKLPFAQCWDPKGWFWRPAEAAKGRIRALEFEAAQR
jgi:hypothetical protein